MPQKHFIRFNKLGIQVVLTIKIARANDFSFIPLITYYLNCIIDVFDLISISSTTHVNDHQSSG